MNTDMTFCSNKECERSCCKRHINNLEPDGLYWFSDFCEGGMKDGKKCEWYWSDAEDEE